MLKDIFLLAFHIKRLPLNFCEKLRLSQIYCKTGLHLSLKSKAKHSLERITATTMLHCKHEVCASGAVLAFNVLLTYLLLLVNYIAYNHKSHKYNHKNLWVDFYDWMWQNVKKFNRCEFLLRIRWETKQKTLWRWEKMSLFTVARTLHVALVFCCGRKHWTP